MTEKRRYSEDNYEFSRIFSRYSKYMFLELPLFYVKLLNKLLIFIIINFLTVFLVRERVT